MPVKYQREMDVARRGAIATQEPRTLVSATNMDAAIIGFGVPVLRHATIDGACTATLTGTDPVYGVTVIDLSAYADRDLTVEGFRQHDECRIMRKGTIWVPAAVAVSAGDPAYVVRATGAFTNVESGNAAVGEWDTSAAIGGLAILRLDL